ncbi:ATP-binding cassette domain-containing protein [Georgenia satyanarayanai]|uniref:ABC transporter ATP-binding protein n=1 Tax=Georgenia satyanarayanai TaxID=860221 RepID=UPI00204234F3|nr:ATP-binding cassette domain-containing protein [Georgenia satyanarayanai]MCM3661631.1 ATP-binding cassette domain-containing protein [Georgenia satyanarayanai]
MDSTTTATNRHEPTSHQATVPVIMARKLGRAFGDVRAVDGIDIDVHRGRIVGFLGPNGSGKSTTLRMMLGLLEPTTGGVTIHGVPYARLESPLTTVGASLDGQAFAPSRTGRQHLRCWAGLAGASRERVDELLDLVGLSRAAERRVGTYSLGMKQRLSLATALLGDPQILVLDEPSNGLDPEGILWLRRTLRELAREGRTVVVASHLLSEAQRMVDDVLLIRDGVVLYQGALAELLASVPAPERGESDLEHAYLHLTRQREVAA